MFQHDLIIKGGTVIEPSSGLHERKDIAITRGKIEDIRRSISEGSSRMVLDANGMVVIPGLIDIHTHTAHDVARLCVDPLKNCLAKGTTTAIDAGSTGELNFFPFAKNVRARSQGNAHHGLPQY